MANIPTVDEILNSLKRHPELFHELSERFYRGELLSAGEWQISHNSHHYRQDPEGNPVVRVWEDPEGWKWEIPGESTLPVEVAETVDLAQGLADEALLRAGYNLLPPLFCPKRANAWEDYSIYGSTYRQRRDADGIALATIVLKSQVTGSDSGTYYLGPDPSSPLQASTIKEAMKLADQALREEGWLLS